MAKKPSSKKEASAKVEDEGQNVAPPLVANIVATSKTDIMSHAKFDKFKNKEGK